MNSNTASRFDKFVDKSGGPDSCWPWLGSTQSDGYGTFKLDGKAVLSHRLQLERKLGRPLRKGYCSCHDCPDGDNPSCCNPDHLWEGTHKQNMDDMWAKGRGNPARGDRNGSRTHPECVPRVRGERHGCAKITALQVRVIKRLRIYNISQRVIGEYVGLSQTQVGRILSGACWGHI